MSGFVDIFSRCHCQADSRMAFASAEAVTFEIAKSRAAQLGKRMARRWGTTRSKAALDLAISKANNSMPGRSQTRTFRKNLAAIIELIAELAAGNKGKLAGSAGYRIALRINKIQGGSALETAAVNRHRLVVGRRRIRCRRHVADGGRRTRN